MRNLRADVSDRALDTSTPRTEFRVLSETRYMLVVEQWGVELEIDRLQRERGELHGELIVRVNWAGAPTYNGILSRSRFNLDSSQTRTRLAKELRTKAKLRPDDPTDYGVLLEELGIRVSEAERAGQPAVVLRDVPRPSPDDTFTVEGFPILRHHPMILFGDGGTAKSLLALLLAGRLVERGWSVLYADWELSAPDHRERLERLFPDEMPLVHYLRCARSISVEAESLQRRVHELGINYVVCDSVGFACDGPPEAAEAANGFFRHLRHIGVGSLNIAHINKGEQGEHKPFGSAFWHNGARSTWFVKAGTPTATGLSVGLFHRKANLGPLRQPIGYEIDFDMDRTTFRRVEVAAIEELAPSLPMWQRIKQAVKHRPLTLAVLAEELDAKVDTIDKTTRRYGRVFTRVQGDDHVTRIALVTKEVA